MLRRGISPERTLSLGAPFAFGSKTTVGQTVQHASHALLSFFLQNVRPTT